MAENLQRFGVTAKGAVVDRITLTNTHITATLLTYGCALQSLRLAGVPHDLTLGSGTLAHYEGPMCYHGTLVGPVANRLTRAAAPIDGRIVQFAANEATGNLLHGGAHGIQTRIWTVADLTDSSVTLSLVEWVLVVMTMFIMNVSMRQFIFCSGTNFQYFTFEV